MPRHMLELEGFAEAYGWHPRETDLLTDEELYWFPVIRQAKAEARRLKQGPQPPPGSHPALRGRTNWG